MTRSSRWIGRAAVCVLALAGCGSGGNEPIAEVRWDQTAPDSGRVVDGAVVGVPPRSGSRRWAVRATR